MKLKYTDNRWIERQVRAIENKCKKAGKAYNTGIARELTYNAIVELRDCDKNGCSVVLDIERFQANKENVLEKYLKKL